MAYTPEDYRTPDQVPTDHSVEVGPDEIIIHGHSEGHAMVVQAMCGEESVRVLREASGAECYEMPPHTVVSFLSSVIGPAGFAQDGPGPYVTFGVPGEKRVRVARSALREDFHARLLSREIMCS